MVSLEIHQFEKTSLSASLDSNAFSRIELETAMRIAQ